MSDVEGTNQESLTAAAPQPAAPVQPPGMDPEKRRKLILLGGAGAIALVVLLIGNLAAHRRRREAREVRQPVAISQADTQSPSDVLPLVAIGGQSREAGGAGAGVSGEEAELLRLGQTLKLVQLRTAVVQAEQQLAELRLDPKAKEQRQIGVEFAQRGAASARARADRSQAGAQPAGRPQPKNPTLSEVTETRPSDSPKPFLLKMGTLLDAVLVNKLVTDNATSPVLAMVDRPYYDPLTGTLLVPAGTRILGKAEAVKVQTASRLAITFDTFQFPNGTTDTVKPDEQALEGLGIFGLQDHVNRHTARVLFTAGLVGILTGWNASQVQGSAGANGAYSGTDLMRIQANDSMSRTAEQLLSPFLNAVPTITVDEGHRMKVWISRDIPMDAYREAPNE
jgi:type IV secretion system protein VirB10